VADEQQQVEGVAEPAVRPFTAVLAEFDDGMVNALLGKELHDLVQAVNTSGRPGKLTLEVTLQPLATSRHGVIEAKAKVTVTPPKSDPHTSIFFTHKDGNLNRSDERQETMPVVKLAGRGETA
jgi:hypothetical protein